MNGTVSWGDRVNAYLLYRRSLGFSLMPESLYLPQFARFAEQKHASRLTEPRLLEPTGSHGSGALQSIANDLIPTARSRPLAYLGECVVAWCPIFIPSRN